MMVQYGRSPRGVKNARRRTQQYLPSRGKRRRAECQVLEPPKVQQVSSPGPPEEDPP